jgi:outer membrane protein assembly factor BamE (lipoprotein component of BamABCDE complex)
VYRNHGFTPTDEELSSIVLGATTRSSVEASIGVPSTSSLTKSDGIYYVSSKWRHFGAAAPKPVERQIVSIQFDSAGVVTNVSRYGLDDGKVIVLSRRVTEGGSGEISFIRQMMGNVGRMDAEDFFGDSN